MNVNMQQIAFPYQQIARNAIIMYEATKFSDYTGGQLSISC